MNINFSKLSLIIKREYLTRVKGKGFIISTILAPVFLIAIFLVPILLASFGSSTSVSVFAIVDETNSVANRMMEANPARYIIKEGVPIDTLRAETLNGTISGYLVISNAVLEGNNNAELYNAGSGGLSLNNEIRDDLRSAVREELFTRTQVNDEVRAIFELRPGIDSRRINAEGEEKVDAESSFLIAYLMGFAIYMAMFGYGALIMQGVMEEKSNRVMEIIVSSAKPIELLIGKVIGIVSLGLTQIIIWFIAFTGISAVMAPLAILMGAEAPAAVEGAAAQAEAFAMPEIAISIWIFFGVFYILGFLIYGGLFAAVGAAADTPQDTSQLALPIYLPIIIPMMLMMPVTTDPNSTLAVVSSLIPFFAPILMMARIVVTDVPLWQSLGSVALMIITFVGLMWMSGKIYRIGILMYGKKVTLSEVYRWLRY